ncbi:MAG: hypothetical protein CVU59_13300 [Deltaproteobacteria bacterium HGW-Deltaproteobacteria-17]|nr:MAG: hypothetical protein CVU59_13300 [Deltaproteobacteria bacterium HGW-Deltaproteobacteria-17]
MHFVEHDHAIRQTPQTHELMAHRQNRQERLINSADAIFRQQCALLVREPLTCAHVARRLRIMDAGGLQALEVVVQQRAAMQELQVERSFAALAFQKAQRAPEHGVASRLRRQCDVQAAMPEAALQFQMRVVRGFGFALAHWRFDEQDGGLAQACKRVRRGLLQGPGREAENLVEGSRRCSEWRALRPADCIQRPRCGQCAAGRKRNGRAVVQAPRERARAQLRSQRPGGAASRGARQGGTGAGGRRA